MATTESAWKYASFVMLGVLVLAVVILVLNKGLPGLPTGNAVATTTQGASIASIDDDAVLGSKSAKVTIIEFSDFQCPFCRKAYTDTLRRIKTEYVDTGKVKMVFRDFPLEGLHPAAIDAALAAECVRAEGGDDAYWKMHDKMFDEQNLLDSGSLNGPVTKTVTFGQTELIAWAQDLGYDIKSCLNDRTFESEIRKDLADGQAAGVQGTPAYFINGKMISGAQPYEVFKANIDAALA